MVLGGQLQPPRPPSSTIVRRYPACTVQVVAEASSSEPLNGDGLPVNMLNDRILVDPDREEGERRSSGGIVIPATAQVGKRLAWARVVAAARTSGTCRRGDTVLFNPEDRYEVEVRGRDYIILRSGTSTPSPPAG